MPTLASSESCCEPCGLGVNNSTRRPTVRWSSSSIPGPNRAAFTTSLSSAGIDDSVGGTGSRVIEKMRRRCARAQLSDTDVWSNETVSKSPGRVSGSAAASAGEGLAPDAANVFQGLESTSPRRTSPMRRRTSSRHAQSICSWRRRGDYLTELPRRVQAPHRLHDAHERARSRYVCTNTHGRQVIKLIAQSPQAKRSALAFRRQMDIVCRFGNILPLLRPR